MTLTDAIGALAAEIAKDVHNVEAAIVSLAGKTDSQIVNVTKQVQALADEVHSVIDDAVDSSNANTWSIDKTKAFVEDRLQHVVAELRASLTPVADATQADFASTYRAAKTPELAPAPEPAPEPAQG